MTGFSEVNRLSDSAGPAGLFEGLLPRSRANLNMGMAIREATGVDGWVAVYIPPDTEAPCEVWTVTGPWGLSITPEVFTPARGKR